MKIRDYTRGTLRPMQPPTDLGPLYPKDTSWGWFWYLVGGAIGLTTLAWVLVWIFEGLLK